MIRAAFAALLLAAGCAATKADVVPAGGVHEYRGASAELPPGWLRIEPFDGLVATRVGFPLQQIRISRYAVGLWKGLEGAASSEYAEMLAGSFDGARHEMELLEVRPATLGGLAATRMTYRWTQGGLSYTSVSVCAVDGARLWLATYSAPTRHYWARDLATFDQVLASIRIAPPPGPTSAGERRRE